MRVAVVGSGAREHALLWALARSARVHRLFALPGNAGTRTLAETVLSPAPGDVEALAGWAERHRIDLVVVGPEAPLVAGLADALRAHHIPTFGPSAAAARIEGSKAFAKDVMAVAGVSTAAAEVFTEPADALAALPRFGPPWVVKADGLAAGKGVTVTSDPAAARAAVLDALVEGVHGDAGRVVLLEEFLEGPEVSVFGVTDGTSVVAFAPARDYKRIGDGDRGPNTGGMGAYSPPADVGADVLDAIVGDVLLPTVRELAARNTPYQGVLYAGLALTARGPSVVEFNCRFGDPEAEVLLPRLESDLAELLLAAATGDMAGQRAQFDPRPCVGIVLASAGYPGTFRRGLPVEGLAEAAATEGAQVFHAGTALHPSGRVVTSGGRVLCVTGMGATVEAARTVALEAAARVRFDGVRYRRDIAAVAG